MPEQSPHPSYQRAVLGLNGSSADPLVVQLAIELGRRDGTELVVLHVVEVDWRHDLDEEIPGSRELASRVLDGAEVAAERARLQVRTELLQARDVGAALVDEAIALDADVIILGLPYRVRLGGDFAMGRTIPYVLQNAPCRVIVVRQSVEEATLAGRAQEGS
ncbi:MAG: universal stress protein [Chloroflexi bacterium]|nr:universal stress protein [Chloroflexota bacterium]